MKSHPFEVLEQERLHVNPLFTIRRDRCRSPERPDPHDFFVLETADWVNVVPLTDAGEVVLVEQFRHGRGALTLEVPGGIIDPQDADPAAAAARELREETGYAARSFVPLGVVEPNPATQNNRCSTFLAVGAWPAGPPQPDLWEDLRVVVEPLARIPELMRNGTIRHALVFAAFHWLTLYQAAAQGRSR